MSSPSPSFIARSLELPSGTILPNRLVKSAMSETVADADGAPGERMVRLYDRLGRGGAGLLISGHVIVSSDGLGEPGNVLVEDARHVESLRAWATAAQANGSLLFAQLNHTGRQSPRRISAQPVAPSAVPLRGFFGTFAPPRALSEREIEILVERFATAATVVKDAGFAGAQVHAAHGYLISQFLSPLTNRREDGWGGSIGGRMRFLLAIVRAIKAAVGPSFPISVKLNSADFQRGGFEVGDAKEVAIALQNEGISILEVSGGNYESPAMAGGGGLAGGVRESTRLREAYFLEYAREIRQVTKVPILLTGGMRTASVMNEVLASGAVDLIGLARPIAAEPDLPKRLLSGEAAGAATFDLATGIKKVDDMLQIFWFQKQLHRMADGLPPDHELGRFSALYDGVKGSLLPGRKASRVAQA